jgi:DNA (cytosine-5)-methyltransferase 1
VAVTSTALAASSGIETPTVRDLNGTTIYNEIDPFTADWLERLIDAGHIAPGRVDRRSIADLTADDVAGHGQRHFFAGIGGWSYALRLAGIPDDADVWTGSCPCQPFSDAGKGLGVRDPRHLWPAWFALIEQCRPPIIFGEQVASRDGIAWLDLVYADLERCGYAVGASDLCAAGIGAPHLRQRLYFVAVSGEQRCEGLGLLLRERRSRSRLSEVGGGSAARGGATVAVGNACSEGSGRHTGAISDEEAQGESEGRRVGRVADELVDASADGCMADSDSARLQDGGQAKSALEPDRMADADERGRQGRVTDGGRSPWGDASRGHDGLVWIDCADGKRRPIPTEPALFPLAHGVPNRVGTLCGSGNAIVPQVAAAFIEAALEAIAEGIEVK